MKAIVSLQRLEGTYHEVGTMNQCVLTSPSLKWLRIKAKRYAKRNPWRMQVWYNETNIHTEPDVVEYSG